ARGPPRRNERPRRPKPSARSIQPCAPAKGERPALSTSARSRPPRRLSNAICRRRARFGFRLWSFASASAGFREAILNPPISPTAARRRERSPSVRIIVRLSTSREEEAEKMSIDTPNTIDPEVAEKFVSEYERNEAELVSYAAKCREGRKPFTERRASIVERATDAGLNRTAFLNEIKERAFLRKIEALKAVEDDQIAEQREMLKSALGGLPLGDWGVKSGDWTDARHFGSPPSAADHSPNPMTLDEAKAILAEPKK